MLDIAVYDLGRKEDAIIDSSKPIEINPIFWFFMLTEINIICIILYDLS